MAKQTILFLKASNAQVRGYFRSGRAVSPYLRRVAKFAAEAHAGQFRKDAKHTPYISHPVKVANILRNEAGITDETVLAAALLHDTVEDCGVDPKVIAARFGDDVARLVLEVTNPEGMPKDEVKRLQVEKSKLRSSGGNALKLSDRIDNLRDVLVSPPADWDSAQRRAYFEHGRQMVDAMPNAHEKLRNIFNEIYSEGLRKL